MVSSFEEIRNLIKNTKKSGYDFLTNFYADQQIVNFWIEEGLLSFIEYKGSSFILKKHLDFYYLYFLATEIEMLEPAIKFLINETSKVYVIDLIEKNNEAGLLPSLFEKSGFRHYENLRRMFLKKNPGKQIQVNTDENFYAVKDDVDLIFNFLKLRLDRYSEQIPTENEIKKMIKNNQMLIVREEEEIEGLLYFSKYGMVSHLMEWIVNEKFRDKHIGSSLIKKYFLLSDECSRMILWVKEQNDQAIQIYKHYGYSFDNVVDRIFVNI